MTHLQYTMIRLQLKYAYDQLRPLILAENLAKVKGPVSCAVESLAIVSETFCDAAEGEDNDRNFAIKAIDAKPSLN